MVLSRIFFHLLAASLLASCDSSIQKKGAHQIITIIQIFPSPSLPASPDFSSNQITILKSQASSKDLPSIEITVIEENNSLKISTHHDDPTIPKEIAQNLLKAYRSHRQALELKTATTLKADIVKQRQLVAKKLKDLSSVLLAYGFPSYDGLERLPETAPNFRIIRQKLSDLENKRDSIENQINNQSTAPHKETLETELERIKLSIKHTFQNVENQIAYHKGIPENLGRATYNKATNDYQRALRTLQELILQELESRLAVRTNNGFFQILSQDGQRVNEATKTANTPRTINRIESLQKAIHGSESSLALKILNNRLQNSSVIAQKNLTSLHTQRVQITPFITHLSDKEFFNYAAQFNLPQTRSTYFLNQYQLALVKERELQERGLASNDSDMRALHGRKGDLLIQGKREIPTILKLIQGRRNLQNKFNLALCSHLKHFEENRIDFSSLQQKTRTLTILYKQNLNELKPE